MVISDNWSYTTDSWRVANGATAPTNCVEWIDGVGTMIVEADVRATAYGTMGGAKGARLGVGISSGTAVSGLRTQGYNPSGVGNQNFPLNGRYAGVPGLGYQYAAWLERGASNDSHFEGDNGADGTQSGLEVIIWN